MMDKFFPGQKVKLVKAKNEALIGMEVTIAGPRRLIKTTAFPEGTLSYPLAEKHPSGKNYEATEDQLETLYDGHKLSSWADLKKEVNWLPKGVKV